MNNLPGSWSSTTSPPSARRCRRSLAFEGYDTELAADGLAALEQIEAYGSPT